MNQFKIDTQQGLTSTPKFLFSKYFYDEIGDKLFVDIMNMPEYYLTRSEMEIFKDKTTELINSFDLNNEPFELIELGAGDGTKTIHLLRELLEKSFDFQYIPIDISQNSLDKLSDYLKIELEELSFFPLNGMYFQVLEKLRDVKKRKIILFLGSNLGNLLDEQASDFLSKLSASMNPNDVLVLGLDLIKSKEIVLPAYNDKSGITEAFNLNVLSRINKEFKANFILDKFRHAPEYNEETGVATSYIESLDAQDVLIEDWNQTIHFEKGEKIHTEISRKYNISILEKLISKTDLKLTHLIMDEKGYFADFILKK
jgi:dimethylhistidine N-methyltransferase